MKQTAAGVFLVLILVFCVKACGKSSSLDSATLGSQLVVQEAGSTDGTEEMKSMRRSLPVKSSANGLKNGKTFTAVSRITRVQT